jgi:Prealbumin-like fold domain
MPLRIAASLLVFTAMATCLLQAQAQPTSDSGIEGMINVSPARPGPARVGAPNSRPLTNTAFVVRNASGVVATFTTDAEGRFRASLPPGHYTVSLKGEQPRIGHFGPFEVDVAGGRMTTVGWQCDSGMR